MYTLFSRSALAVSRFATCVLALTNQESLYVLSRPITIESFGTDLNGERSLPVLLLDTQKSEDGRVTSLQANRLVVLNVFIQNTRIVEE